MQHFLTPKRGPRRPIQLNISRSQSRQSEHPKAQLHEQNTRSHELVAPTRDLVAPTHDRVTPTHDLVVRDFLTRKILDLTPSGLCLLDMRHDHFVYVNQRDLDFFGVPLEVFLSQGQEFALGFFHPDDVRAYQAQCDRLEAGEDSVGIEVRMHNAGGNWCWIDLHAYLVERDPAGRPALVLFTSVDVTARREMEERLRYTATHDALTGLYNWAYFEEALEKVRQSDAFPASILIMDVDNLKTINDTIGHLAGDHLLRRISGVLLTVFKAEDTLARLGGDEFAALLPDVDEAGARKMVQRVRARLAEATLVKGTRLDALSIGASTAAGPEQLYHARHLADQEMYSDKQRRKK